MMNSRTRIAAFSIFTILLIHGCKTEQECKPQGKWYFAEVTRNYRITNTLVNGYIEFIDDQSLKSNLFDENETYKYTIADRKLTIDADEQLSLTINACSPDSIDIEGELSYFLMRFKLTKTPNILESNSVESKIEDSSLY